MRTKIQTWGRSLGLRSPRRFAEAAGIKAGAEFELSIRSGDLVLNPASHRTPRLRELLRMITPNNIHAEVDTSAPLGHEIW